MRKFINKFVSSNAEVILLSFFGIIIPSFLFMFLAEIIKRDLPYLSFMDSTDNFLLYFATLFSTGVSALVNFLVLKVTFEENKKNLQEQRKDLNDNFKRQFLLSCKTEQIKKLNKITEIMAVLDGKITNIMDPIGYTININMIDIEYFVIQSNKLKNLYNEVYINNLDDNIKKELYSDSYEKLKEICAQIEDFIGGYSGFIDDEGMDLYELLFKLKRSLTSCRKSIQNISIKVVKSMNNVSENI